MRMPIGRQLTLTFLVVLVFGMVLAAGLAWLAVQGLFLETLSENLLSQAELTAVALQDSALQTGLFPGADFEPYTQTANVQPGIHTRLLGEQGGVVVGLPLSAEVQVPAAEESEFITSEALQQRPEVRSAMAGVASTAVRVVENRRVLYAAAPVYTPDGEVAGLVYLATPLVRTGLPVRIILQLGGALLAAVLLAGVVGSVLARRIARPLEALSQAADAVAGGDLDQAVPVRTGIREVRSLGESFNSMTTNLQRSDRAKNAFLADVTHELRTPLTVIKGTVETLEDGALDDIEGRGPLLAAMHRETDRLIRLVSDLLVLARADAGALNLRFVELDLAALAQARCEGMALLAGPRKVKLAVEASGSISVRGDADRLTQVLDNLLDNAIRHAPAGSTVAVEIRCQDDRVECTVRDQGPGIPADHLALIFERFYRADEARSRHDGGSGLGLAIVQSLVAAHGGGVWAGDAEGQGALVGFWLPAA